MPPARMKRPNHSTVKGMYLANPVGAGAAVVAAPGSLLVMELGNLLSMELGNPGMAGILGNPGMAGILGKDNPPI